MSGDLAEEYGRLVRPEFYERMDDLWRNNADVQNVFSDFRAKYGDMTEARAREISRARVRRHLAQFDDGILGAVGFTVDDLIDIRDRKRREEGAGGASPKSPKRIWQRRQAFLAIHEADKAGKSWGDTIIAAQAASMLANGQELDRKTVDRWLRELHQWGEISISPPPPRGRGRPRKKE